MCEVEMWVCEVGDDENSNKHNNFNSEKKSLRKMLSWNRTRCVSGVEMWQQVGIDSKGGMALWLCCDLRVYFYVILVQRCFI